MAKVFPDIKYLIQSGIMMIGSWSWNNRDTASGSAYNEGDVYCLSVTVPASVGHGDGIKFSSPIIDTDGLSALRIDFASISAAAYYVVVNISDQDGDVIISDTVSIQGTTSNTYAIPESATGIIISIMVSMAAGTNILKIRNILLC